MLNIILVTHKLGKADLEFGKADLKPRKADLKLGKTECIDLRTHKNKPPAFRARGLFVFKSLRLPTATATTVTTTFT